MDDVILEIDECIVLVIFVCRQRDLALLCANRACEAAKVTRGKFLETDEQWPHNRQTGADEDSAGFGRPHYRLCVELVPRVPILLIGLEGLDAAHD